MTTLKRLARDCRDFTDMNVCITDKSFAMHNPNNIKEAYAMIIGPDDTPYEGGFFFFRFDFTNEYPFKPPSAKSLTQGSGIRFNPNMYTCGKVCLSILGTWNGPGWSALYNLKKVLTSLLGQVLVENPLNNEPGYDTRPKTDPECVSYSAITAYGTWKHAIVEAMNGKIPVPDMYKPYFQDIINKYVVANSEKYTKRVNSLLKSDNKKSFSTGYQSQKQTPDYTTVLRDYNSSYAKLPK